MVASSPEPLRLKEVPYEFRNCHAGEGKLDSQAMWGYFMLLADKLIGHIVPVRFVAFALVGTVGVFVHFAVLSTLFRVMAVPFRFSQGAATVAAMVGNFALNNALTYRDMRLKGWQWIKGLASFGLSCSLGALANVGIASYLFRRDTYLGRCRPGRYRGRRGLELRCDSFLHLEQGRAGAPQVDHWRCRAGA